MLAPFGRVHSLVSFELFFLGPNKIIQVQNEKWLSDNSSLIPSLLLLQIHNHICVSDLLLPDIKMWNYTLVEIVFNPIIAGNFFNTTH